MIGKAVGKKRSMGAEANLSKLSGTYIFEGNIGMLQKLYSEVKFAPK